MPKMAKKKKRNKEISKIERKMEKQEALELEPNTPRNRTGYYDQLPTIYAIKKQRKSLEDTWGVWYA